MVVTGLNLIGLDRGRTFAHAERSALPGRGTRYQHLAMVAPMSMHDSLHVAAVIISVAFLIGATPACQPVEGLVLPGFGAPAWSGHLPRPAGDGASVIAG